MEHLLQAAEEAKQTQPEEDKLDTISKYAKSLVKKQGELKALEDKVKEKKKECTKLSQELIPQSMLEVNMTALKLDTGQTVEFTEELNTTLKDAEMLYDFLEERGDGSLMKITLVIGKVPKTILAKIVAELNAKFGILAETELYLHHQTLKAYFKKLCGVGGQDKAEIPLAKIDENMLTTFTYYKTVVK